MLLAGDIGGTKTSLSIFSAEDGPRHPAAEGTLPSGEYDSLEALVGDFLRDQRFSIDHASFGVAGPVVGGRVRTTNLPWLIEEQSLERELNIPTVRLLNDLASIAYAVPRLQPHEVETLHAGRPVEGGAIAVIAPGTGLGEAFLVWAGAHYQVCPSEGGHADFAPSSPREMDMLRYLLQSHDHVSWERVCSGIGIPNIYNFLKDTGCAEEPAWLRDKLASAHDPVPVIMNNAQDSDEPCELCTATLEVFVSALASEAGNLALTVLSTGGVYLGGGIPPRILPALKTERFLQIFRRKGRFAALLDHVPVHVILNPKVALLGAAFHGLEAAG